MISLPVCQPQKKADDKSEDQHTGNHGERRIDTCIGKAIPVISFWHHTVFHMRKHNDCVKDCIKKRRDQTQEDKPEFDLVCSFKEYKRDNA